MVCCTPDEHSRPVRRTVFHAHDAAQNFREIARIKEVLQAAGVPCVRHLLAVSAAQALAFGELVGFSLVAKPPAGAGGKRTFGSMLA